MFPKTTTSNSVAMNGLDFYLTHRSAYAGYNPVLKNTTAPLFHLLKQNKLTAEADALLAQPIVSLEDLLDYQQPIVLAFYSANDATILSQLESLQADVKVMGGRLIVLTETSIKQFRKAGNVAKNLTIYHDENGAIAEAFGVFNAQNPLWQWVSGIDNEDVALPSFHLIAPDATIAYQFVDESFETYKQPFLQQAFVRELLTAVYNARFQYSHSGVQYKSVS